MQAVTRAAPSARTGTTLVGLAISLGLLMALNAGAQTAPEPSVSATGPDTDGAPETPPKEANTNIGRWYQLELILFTRQGAPDTAESWPRFPDLTTVEKARSLWQPPTRLGELQAPLPAASLAPTTVPPLQWPLVDPVTGKEKPYVVLPQSKLQLRDEAAAINGSSNRSVVLHTGWTMPVQGEENADFFRLHTELDSSPRHRTELDGTLRIYVSRYLHVATQLFATDYQLAEEPLRVFFGDSPGPDLTLALASADTRYGPWRPELRRPGTRDSLAPQWVAAKSVRFTASRRMRSNELHYLDHPRLGLIIRFTPYEPYDRSAAQESAEGEASPAGAGDSNAEAVEVR